MRKPTHSRHAQSAPHRMPSAVLARAVANLRALAEGACVPEAAFILMARAHRLTVDTDTEATR